MTKKQEDVTLDEIREHMALFSRLYYHKRKEEDPEHIERVRDRKRITGKALYHKKKAERGERRENTTKHNMPWLLSQTENNIVLVKHKIF